MKEIWKYVLNTRCLPIEIPKGGKILCTHNQGNDICIWAEVDPEAKTELRYFEVYGTGHSMLEKPRTYIGTAFLGQFVFHVFEKGDPHGKAE